MIPNVFLCHPKVDVSYNPFLDGYVSFKIGNLDDSEPACKSSKIGCFVQSIFLDM